MCNADKSMFVVVQVTYALERLIGSPDGDDFTGKVYEHGVVICHDIIVTYSDAERSVLSGFPPVLCRYDLEYLFSVTFSSALFYSVMPYGFMSYHLPFMFDILSHVVTFILISYLHFGLFSFSIHL